MKYLKSYSESLVKDNEISDLRHSIRDGDIIRSKELFFKYKDLSVAGMKVNGVDDGIEVKIRALCWASEYKRKDLIKFFIENGANGRQGLARHGIGKVMNWLQFPTHINLDDKIEILNYLQSFIDSGKAFLSKIEKDMVEKSKFKNFAELVINKIEKNAFGDFGNKMSDILDRVPTTTSYSDVYKKTTYGDQAAPKQSN